ncbi:hypothetical protein DESPIG_01566 [Desulfovibrio piger ATCC 29098]|uniref:Uncharacterized protein n=1 Tax=Desulfovibrio piger ATCC 29098 TaxID=411464 RepID=B6WU08_9BACT|nr:hypothetical protein DESPIG_01566 [Desulfovibrio piger ATCC 29098]
MEVAFFILLYLNNSKKLLFDFPDERKQGFPRKWKILSLPW